MSHLFLKFKLFFPARLKQILLLLAIFIFAIFYAYLIKPSLAEKTPKKTAWIHSFLRELLLEESAIYTLWGTKPITECVLYYYTDQEMMDWYNQMSEEERKTTYFVENPHFEENWEKWEKIQNQFPMKEYQLFKRANPDNPKSAFLYFVNILQTALTLRQHYSLFAEAIGHDFNPFDVACDFKNEDSEFWKAIQGNSALTGILFGFGAENSWIFHWKYFDHADEYNSIAQAITLYPSDTSRRGNHSLADFSLPIFMVVDIENETIKKYEKERKAIQEIYRGKDFVELTLQKMTSQQIITLPSLD